VEAPSLLEKIRWTHSKGASPAASAYWLHPAGESVLAAGYIERPVEHSVHAPRGSLTTPLSMLCSAFPPGGTPGQCGGQPVLYSMVRGFFRPLAPSMIS
jgi:hypothetical protein